MARFAGSLLWADAPPARRAAWAAPSGWPAMRHLLGPSSVEACASLTEARLAVWTPDGRVVDGIHHASAPGIAVAFNGYLRDLPAGHRGEPDVVLAAYQADDWAWLREASGVFAFAVLDQVRGRAVLATDRLGMRPLFFAQDRAGVAFASDLGALAPWGGAQIEIDHDGLQEMVALGFPLGSRTPWRHVECVPPGSRLELGPGRRRLHQYWSLGDLPAVTATDPDRFVDESRERLRHALTRMLERSGGDLLCLLSAGHDSRRLLLEAHGLGARLETITAAWGYPARPGTSLDPAVVREICGRLSVPNRVVSLPGSRDSLALAADRRARDALLAHQVKGRDHVWAMPLLASLPASSARPNLDGIAGDTFFNNPFYFLPRALWGCSRPDRRMLDAIVPEHERLDRGWGNLISSPLSERVREAIEALPDGPYRLSHFYLLGRTRRMVALLPYGLLDLRVESFCPYLDRDVMDHAHTLDPVVKGELRLQARALHRHHPPFRDIPSSHSAPADVAPAYLTPMDVADPDASSRFTGADLWRLLRPSPTTAWRPRIARNDVAVVGLEVLGLGGSLGAWRKPRLLDLLHAVRTVDASRAGRARGGRARGQALDWLARGRI
ncbi:MAG: hypothetical protein WEG40_01570 [Candidatus Rokuibacteriota bacterium]